MNHNLKNRPRYGTLIQSESYIMALQKYDEWFEGFEKELRAMVHQPEYSDEYKLYSAEDVIKQILGEEPE